MKQIPLTQGLFALVDDKDFEWLSQWKWFTYKHRNTFYAKRMSKTADGKRTTTLMHVEIIGRRKGLITDHITGVGLDNRRENLRHVTQRQNLQNLHIETSSKYPGVYWHKQKSKWHAVIRVNGKRKHLGYFTGELEAFDAYRKAAETLGDFVLRNM